MADFTLINSESKPLTRTLAEEFRDLKPSPTERDMNPGRLKHLKDKAEAGHLITFNWSRAKVGDEWLRMNGQHSSAMLCDLNGSFPENLIVHLDEYEVDNIEGLALLFRQFDDRKSGRTPGDVAGAYQGLYEPLRAVPKISAKIAVEGYTWYQRNIEGAPTLSGDDQYQAFAYEGVHSFIQWIGEIFSIKTPEMKRLQVVSAMYATFIANEKEARKFWDMVARGGVDYEESHPATVLADWLLKAKEKDMKQPPKPAHYYQAGIFAWNAHREGKTVPSIKIDTKKSWLTPVN
jgi:hypothetical protein